MQLVVKQLDLVVRDMDASIAFWGARYAIVEDPDGNQIGFMSPSDPARRGPPPDL